MNAPARISTEARTLGAELAIWRASNPLAPACSIILFGVELATLQRIERGEVEPEAELAERIARVIFEPSTRPPARPAPHAGHAQGARPNPARARRGGGSSGRGSTHASSEPPSRPCACQPGLTRSESPKPAPISVSAYLAKLDGATWNIVLTEPGLKREIPIDHARALIAELGPLVAIHDNPRLFEE